MSEIEKKAIAEIEKMARKQNLPEDIATSAIELFKSLHKGGFVRSRSSICVARACLYYIAKLDPSCPAVNLRNFANEGPCSQKKIFHYYAKIVEKFGMQPQVCTIRPTIYVKSFGQKLGFSEGTLKKAIELSEEIVKEKIHIGKSPIIVAAACLYIASHICKERRTLFEIADISGITEPGIKRFLKEPFFKDLRECVRPVNQPVGKNILQKFIRELLGKIDIKPDGMPVYQFRRELRLHFSKELAGLTIGFVQFIEILEELKNEGLINLIAGPECFKRRYEKIEKPNCELCYYKKTCSDYIIQPRKIN
jgi:transcription initiation factor TFIIIB Brf1 subunit/transcription initiation factor TFIIB